MKPAREVAHNLLREMGRCNYPTMERPHTPWCDKFAAAIEAAEARGFERGATWMREQAALESERPSYSSRTVTRVAGYSLAVTDTAGRIRALPTVPK